MVLLDEDYTICTIRNTIENSEIKKLSLTVRPSYTVSKLYSDVRTQLDINNFSLVLENPSSTNHVHLSLKENKTLGEVGIVFKRSHRNIILVLPPSGSKKKVEKIIPQTDLISDVSNQQLEAVKEIDQLKSDNNQIDTIPEISEPPIDVKPEGSAKKKIVKVKTVKTGTKTVKIKSEKTTTTTTLENGVTEVKKKTVKKQTDTIELPNGITNGVTSEECIVTNSIHTTNGDHFEEKNIEVTSCQSEIHPINTEQTLSLTDRRSSSSELDDTEPKKSIEHNHLEVSSNGIDKKSSAKHRSLSPIEIANYNFVVAKKNLKQRLEAGSGNILQSEIGVSQPAEIEVLPAINYSEALHESVKLNDSSDSTKSKLVDADQLVIHPETTKENNQNESSEEQTVSQANSIPTNQTKTSVRSELSPARFQIDLSGASTDQVDQSKKESTTPFLRSEVSPARFTIKLTKKKIEPKAESGQKPEIDAADAHKVKVGAKVEVCSKGKIESKNKEEPRTEVEVESKAKVGLKTEVGPKTKAFSKVEVGAKAEIEPKAKVGRKAEIGSKSEVCLKKEVDSKAKVGPKTEVGPEAKVASEVDVSSKTEVGPKTKTCYKTELGAKAEVGLKKEVDTKAEVGLKKEVDSKAEAGLKSVVDSKAKVGTKAEVGFKKEVDPKSEVDLEKEADPKAKVGTKAEVGSELDISPKGEVVPKRKSFSKTELGAKSEVGLKKEVDSKAKFGLKAKVAPEVVTPTAESNIQAEAATADVVPASEVTPQAEISCKPEIDLKAEVGIKPGVESKVKVESKSEVHLQAENPTKSDICSKIEVPKVVIDTKFESDPKAEVTPKTDIGPKILRKTSENNVIDSATNGTTEVKKRLVKKVKDSTSPPSEIKKKVVKKVISPTTKVTENGIGEVKVKVVKKKSELNTDVVPEVKVKIVKKKLEPVASTPELNAIEEQLQHNHIENAKVEEPEPKISVNIEPIEETTDSQIESKMDEDNDTKKYYGEAPLFIETTQQLDEIPPSDEERRMLGLDDDLALGASASPVESKSETSNNYIPLAICDTPSSSTDYAGKLYSGPKPSYGYVGLVNQAMTCYLNSLLQALFMTPEFRNALYNWEFDGHEESKSIPYQLQKLFLNLQTSSKVAIETTDLTKSFGWTSSDAWHQHDVQELCRVMFDALEQKFKNTKQADLINRLYEGKMIDYVKCLECSTEKTREDTLLDIPLPVRPFGSNMAYGSVEEALRAFVQPETLDGNNQYFCDKCDKKCDAHKGLKFTKFPYILTLHLKRFDFDYNTLHRIKLNDKVTFPQLLNLNSFVKESDNIGFVQHNGGCSSEHGSIESAIKCDDCSTTDSGSALEEEGTTFTATGNNNNDGDLQEDDEGIDMSASTDTKNHTSNESGPYIYELFAIMIHSGSASGGHYYAYIRDFNNGEWYCFNDQTVSSASHEDIERSFGGGSAKTYYSSAYNSSTNAYMLMYRQQDSLRNDAAIKVEEFPPHIKKLLRDLRQREETERQNKARETELLKLKVYFFNPKTQRMQDARIFMPSDSDLKTTLEDAHSHFNLEKLVPIERCRLVGYCHSDENIIRSYEGKDEETLTKVLFDLNPLELLLEVRSKDSEFEVYPPGGVLTKLHKVDLATGDVDLPILFRAITSWTVFEYKTKIAEKLGLNVEQIILAVLKPYSNHARIIDEDVPHRMSKQDRVFAAVSTSPFEDGVKLTKIVERFEHIITLFFLLPATDKETLEKMSIPSYVEKQTLSPSSTTSTPPKLTVSTDVVDAIMHAAPLPVQNHTITSDSNYNQVPLQLELESCSEDSSLSDGDRTLVDSAPDMADVSSTNNSPTCSDTQMSSMEYHSKRYNDFDCDDDNETVEVTKTRNYYFKAVYFEEPYKDDESIKTNRMLKVLVDKGMIIGNLKRALEPFVKVPKEYFKIFKTSSNTETECHRLTESLNIFSDNERLVIELGRALRKGEYKCKISYLKLSQIKDDMEQLTFMCDWILRNGANVGQTKREIIAHLATLGYDFQYENCRLRHQNRRLPMEIYLDDQKFGDDIRLSENVEVILQELEETSQPYSYANDKCLFVRQWSPSTMTIGGFQEITISENSELKNVLSTISGIPEENIEYAMPSGLFPRYNLNVMTMHTTSLTWCSSTVKADEWPLNNAHNSDCFIFRDKTEPLKQLTPEESRELKNKERLRTGGSSTYSSYSPRRERGLKIDV